MAKSHKNESPIGRRCAMGCETWPDESRFSTCPQCGEPTRRYRGAKPLAKADAESALKHAEFDHFYDTEWVQDNDPLTDVQLADMGISLDVQEVHVAPEPGSLLTVPHAPNPATIHRSPDRFLGRNSAP